MPSHEPHQAKAFVDRQAESLSLLTDRAQKDGLDRALE
jgi:hypothetical protein